MKTYWIASCAWDVDYRWSSPFKQAIRFPSEPLEVPVVEAIDIFKQGGNVTLDGRVLRILLIHEPKVQP